MYPQSVFPTHNTQIDNALFLGVGSARTSVLGHSSCVLRSQDRPILLIDCGPGVLEAYVSQFSSLPSAIFITHLHFDHIGDLEQLFFKAVLESGKVSLFVPVNLVPRLCRILENTGMAEGGCNIWDVIRLVPVTEYFYTSGVKFYAVAVRHHAPDTAFGLWLPGVVFYTGDTRPIPEVLNHTLSGTETIFHDVSLAPNPSHSGAQELLQTYHSSVLQRLWVYHYANEDEINLLYQLGFNVVKKQLAIQLALGNVSSAVRC